MNLHRDPTVPSTSHNVLQLFNPRYLSHIFPTQYDSYPDRFIKAENIKLEVSAFI